MSKTIVTRFKAFSSICRIIRQVHRKYPVPGNKKPVGRICQNRSRRILNNTLRDCFSREPERYWYSIILFTAKQGGSKVVSEPYCFRIAVQALLKTMRLLCITASVGRSRSVKNAADTKAFCCARAWKSKYRRFSRPASTAMHKRRPKNQAGLNCNVSVLQFRPSETQCVFVLGNVQKTEFLWISLFPSGLSAGNLTKMPRVLNRLWPFVLTFFRILPFSVFFSCDTL